MAAEGGTGGEGGRRGEKKKGSGEFHGCTGFIFLPNKSMMETDDDVRIAKATKGGDTSLPPFCGKDRR